MVKIWNVLEACVLGLFFVNTLLQQDYQNGFVGIVCQRKITPGLYGESDNLDECMGEAGFEPVSEKPCICKEPR